HLSKLVDSHHTYNLCCSDWLHRLLHALVLPTIMKPNVHKCGPCAAQTNDCDRVTFLTLSFNRVVVMRDRNLDSIAERPHASFDHIKAITAILPVRGKLMRTITAASVSNQAESGAVAATGAALVSDAALLLVQALP